MTTLTTQVTRHFECLGYDVAIQPDGWTLATHPVRLNVLFKPYAIGVRLFCASWLGAKRINQDEWQSFLNHANDTSVFSRFSIAQDDEGDWCVRVRALLPGRYDRKTFGLLLDAWQEDVALLRRAPRASADDGHEDKETEEEEKAVVVVN